MPYVRDTVRDLTTDFGTIRPVQSLLEPSGFSGFINFLKTDIQRQGFQQATLNESLLLTSEVLALYDQAAMNADSIDDCHGYIASVELLRNARPKPNRVHEPEPLVINVTSVVEASEKVLHELRSYRERLGGYEDVWLVAPTAVWLKVEIVFDAETIPWFISMKSAVPVRPVSVYYCSMIVKYPKNTLSMLRPLNALRCFWWI